MGRAQKKLKPAKEDTHVLLNGKRYKIVEKLRASFGETIFICEGWQERYPTKDWKTERHEWPDAVLGSWGILPRDRLEKDIPFEDTVKAGMPGWSGLLAKDCAISWNYPKWP